MAAINSDAIYSNRIAFPEKEAERQIYVQAVSDTVKKIDDYSLKWLQDFDRAVKNQVGEGRIENAQIYASHFSTKYYVWTLSHPHWATVFKIISIGFLQFVANNGKHLYDENRPFVQLCNLLYTLQIGISQRMYEVRDLELGIRQMVSANCTLPERMVEAFEQLERYHEVFDKRKHGDILSCLFSSEQNSSTYANIERSQAIERIYELTKNREALANFRANRKVYADSENWNRLLPDVQHSHIVQMAKNPQAFSALLATRVAAFTRQLHWDVFSSTSEGERQSLVRQIATLGKDLPSWCHHKEVLRQSYNDLLTHIKTTVFKECSWSEEDTRHLQRVSEELGLKKEFETAFEEARLVKCLQLAEFVKLLPQEREKVLKRAYSAMATDDSSSSIQTALTEIYDAVQKTVLKECFVSQEEAAFVEDLCRDLDLFNEYVVARETYFLEKSWLQEPYGKKIANTQKIAPRSQYYQQELERRRLEVFGMAKNAKDLDVKNLEYLLAMLQALMPHAEKGCERELRCIKEQVLSTMADKAAREDESKRQDFIQKAALLDIDPEIINDLTDNGLFYSFLKFLQTGTSSSARLEKNVERTLKNTRVELRRIGCPTEIVRLPLEEELAHLKFRQQHFAIVEVSEANLQVEDDVRHLMDFIKEADERRLVANRLKGLKGDGSVQQLSKEIVFDRLSRCLAELHSEDPKDSKLLRVKKILMAYTSQLKKQFTECRTSKEQDMLYEEVVARVGVEMGFAFFECNDRRYNAAMEIYREKIAKEGFEGAATDVKVLLWAAKKRNELVTGMLHTMIRGQAPGEDVASSIGCWRYKFRDQFGLGDVPRPAYECTGGLDAKMITKHFQELYTPKWLLEQAMDDHRKDGGASIMKISAIHDFLGSRLSNYDNLKNGLLHEETYALLDSGMALYLQEAGVFEALV